MNQENRVLGRTGARELTQEEVANVTGAFQKHTLTLCTVDRKGNSFNGDTAIGECG